MNLTFCVLLVLQASFCEVHVGAFKVGLNKEFVSVKLLGKGSFGQVWSGRNTKEKPPKDVAMKLESVASENKTLPTEMRIYTVLKNIDGIPKVYYKGKDSNYNVIVMDQLGASFEKIQKKYKGTLSFETIAIFAIQALQRLKAVHDDDIVHRDLKPHNFALDSTGKKVILFDFGCAMRYKIPGTNTHVSETEKYGQVGTLRYMSRGAHRYYNQGRANDLESLGYVLYGFAKDKFPWDKLFKSLFRRNIKIFKMKRDLKLKKFCEGLPTMFFKYLEYVRNLKFSETPNYVYLQRLFKSYLSSLGMEEDAEFDWTKEEQSTNRYKDIAKPPSLVKRIVAKVGKAVCSVLKLIIKNPISKCVDAH